jgi:hypothetical protein
MKKYILLLLITLSSIFSYSQEFNGVLVDGDLPSFVSKMKAKNYTLRKYIENGAIMDGKVGYNDVEVFIFTTPKSKKVFRLSVYFPKKTTWSSLKGSYLDLLSSLTSKYGEPTNKGEIFKDPYYEGDGYEMSAVAIEKVVYLAYWEYISNLFLSIEISKYSQVNIVYDNVTNVAIRDKEIKSINTNIL